MSAVDGFLAPVVTEIMLAGLARLRADGGPAHLYVGSPWLSDFPLFPGVFAGSFPYLLPDAEPSDVATIGNLVATWSAYGGSVTIVVQKELMLLGRCLDAGAEVYFGKGFHSKFIAVPDVVVSGSANMTYYGFYRNFEHLHVHRFAAAPAEYESERQACLNHVATAHGLGMCSPPAKLTGRLLAAQLKELRSHIA